MTKGTIEGGAGENVRSVWRCEDSSGCLREIVTARPGPDCFGFGWTHGPMRYVGPYEPEQPDPNVMWEWFCSCGAVSRKAWPDKSLAIWNGSDHFKRAGRDRSHQFGWRERRAV